MKESDAVKYFMVLVVIASSCGSSLKISSDYDKQADFGQYKTFTLYNPGNIKEAISQLNQGRIISSIKGEMIKKGFQEDSASPDLLVNTTAVLKDRVGVSSTSSAAGYGYGYGSMYRPYTWGPGVSYTDSNVKHYKDGSLIIDVVEANSKKLLWQGIGNKEIDAPIKDPDTNIPKIIATIMYDFPPGKSRKK